MSWTIVKPTPFAAWLQAHPGTQIICRDRAGNYAEGARAGAPDATQVADRWHIWANLRKATEVTVRAHRADLREPEAAIPEPAILEPAAVPAPPVEAEPRPEPHKAIRTRERHAAVHQLLGQGWTITAISQQLNLDRKTVRKFVGAATADQLINGARSGRRCCGRGPADLQSAGPGAQVISIPGILGRRVATPAGHPGRP